MNNKQHTLANSFELQGKGLHTGLDINIKFSPAACNYGIRIRRVDLPDKPTLSALAEFVSKTDRGTVLSNEKMKVSTIEHAMAALYALGVDNCLIEVDAPEFPIMDGSARSFVEKIQEVGLEEQSQVREEYIVTKKIEVSDPKSGTKLTLLPDDRFCANVLISFDSVILSNQYASLECLDDFAEEISTARTFVFVREIKELLERDLIKGGDLDNAIVIYDQKLPQEQMDKLANSVGVKDISADQLGYINNKPLQYNNEPARHKLLDLLGDLALIGCRLRGRVIATCPGHSINTKLAKLIRKDIRQNQERAPIYDPNRPALMTVQDINKLLPHRFPMLMVDKVMEIGSNDIIAVKNFSINEPFFQGHFPGDPVVPGVLLVEGAAQAAGIMVMSQLKKTSCGYSTYFVKIDNTKFRHKVVPGDTVVFRVSFIEPVRRSMASMRGVGFVGDKLVFETEFLAQIIKNNRDSNDE